MEQRKCQYGLTLEQCNKKWEAPCQNDDHNCEFQIQKNTTRGKY